MYSQETFLKIGDFNGTDFLSLTKSGNGQSSYDFSSRQGINNMGKTFMDVYWVHFL